MKFNKRMVTDINVANKVVFLRLDLNVPVIDGKITSFKRINSSLPTIKYLLDHDAKVVILSHMGRPKSADDVASGKFSLRPVAEDLAKKLSNDCNSIAFSPDNTGPVIEAYIKEMRPRDVLVLENTRYNDVLADGSYLPTESANSEYLGKYWADLCDVFVNDAFGAAHRRHASIDGIASRKEENAIGFLMETELRNLNHAVKNGKKPLVVIFGGAKISDKLKAITQLAPVADYLIIGGGMAYTFCKAQGFNVGKSMVEDSMIPAVKELMAKYGDKITISSDFECAKEFENSEPIYRTVEEGLEGLMGLDIGPKSIESFKAIIAKANTIVWNGPMGVTEFSHYATGTNEICKAIADRTEAGAFTVIGGGDSAAAAEKLNKETCFSFISTGGGASLKFLEGSTLEGIESIKNKGE